MFSIGQMSDGVVYPSRGYERKADELDQLIPELIRTFRNNPAGFAAGKIEQGSPDDWCITVLSNKTSD